MTSVTDDATVYVLHRTVALRQPPPSHPEPRLQHLSAAQHPSQQPPTCRRMAHAGHRRCVGSVSVADSNISGKLQLLLQMQIRVIQLCFILYYIIHY